MDMIATSGGQARGGRRTILLEFETKNGPDMMNPKRSCNAALAGAIALLAAACTETPADNVAGQLENAADQSYPAAANVLDDAADDIRDGSADPQADARNAVEQAANAQEP